MRRLREFLIAPRIVDADYHFYFGREWLLFGKSAMLNSPLVYAALEFRASLERVAFELLILFRGTQVGRDDLKRSKNFGNLMGLLGELEGDQISINRKLRFVQIICELSALGHSPAIINVGELRKSWEICSELCHKQYSADNTWKDHEFVVKGYKNMEAIDTYLDSILVQHKLIWLDQFPPEVADIRSDFVNGDIDENETAVRLRLAQPVLHQRRLFDGFGA